MMKILITTTYYLPNISGITTYIKALAEGLVNRNHEVTILTSHHDKKCKMKEKVNKVKIIRLWSPTKLGKGVLMPFYPISAFSLVKKNDVINCHLPSIESFYLAFWNIFFKKRLIVTYHCDFDSGNIFINKIIFLIQILVLKTANKIVVNTNDYIKSYGLLKNYQNKIEEIYPPVINHESNINDKKEINDKLKNIGNKKIIGFLGRISKEKNLELLFESIPLVKRDKINFVILIAGPEKVLGEEKYKIKIEKYFKKYKNEIIRLGELKNVNYFLKRCDCLLVTSNNRLESFGIVQVESIRNGTPCIVNNLPGTREVVLKTKMGEIFETNNLIDFSRKISEVLTRGKKYYKDREVNLDMFDYHKSIDKYEKIFDEFIN